MSKPCDVIIKSMEISNRSAMSITAFLSRIDVAKSKKTIDRSPVCVECVRMFLGSDDDAKYGDIQPRGKTKKKFISPAWARTTNLLINSQTR